MDENKVSQLEKHGAINVREDAGAALRMPIDLCYENAETVIDSFSDSLARRPARVTVNLGKVRAMDSSGLRALIRGRRMCEEAGTDFEIEAISECAAKVIRMSGFADLLGLQRIPFLTECPDASTADSPLYSPWKTFEHVVNSDPSLISELREKVAAAAGEAGIDPEALCDVRIAVGEALSNAYKHGSPHKGYDKIILRYMTCPQALVVEVQDEGRPFDPTATAEPDPKLMRDHGMGIYLMRQAMDVVEFKSACPGNRVRMIKWLKG